VCLPSRRSLSLSLWSERNTETDWLADVWTRRVIMCSEILQALGQGGDPHLLHGAPAQQGLLPGRPGEWLLTLLGRP
jgi:hypothetical protein